MSNDMFRFSYGTEEQATQELVLGRDFRLDEQGLYERLCQSFPARTVDLLRIGMAVYVTDRLVRRSNSVAWRELRMRIGVSDLDFWQQAKVMALLRDAIQSLCDDTWHLEFEPGSTHRRTQFLPFAAASGPIEHVCLYSGGLDSAAGLSARLADGNKGILAATARHQADQKNRVIQQITQLNRHFGPQVAPVSMRTTLMNAPLHREQELTQRCRAFLFAAFGGAVAQAFGLDEVEVYESGVGAVNLPLMNGMLISARSTKSSHPHFLRLMSDLLALVSGRRIDFRLVFRDRTKAEVTRHLSKDNVLRQIANATVSCVHYPLRDAKRKQCGTCPACIGRRQALIVAGIQEPIAAYKFDLFGSAEGVNSIPTEHLDFIRATVFQVFELGDLTTKPCRGQLFWRHAYATQLLANGESAQLWVDVLRRYRQEWLDIIRHGQEEGWGWASAIEPVAP